MNATRAEHPRLGMHAVLASGAFEVGNRPHDWTDSVPPVVLWLVLGLMLLGFLALVVWIFKSVFSSAQDVAKSIGATPAAPLSQLGLRTERLDAGGGEASGYWQGIPVRVRWALSASAGGVDFDMPRVSTTFIAQLASPLSMGMNALEQAHAPPLGDPRLDGRLALHSSSTPAARSALLRSAGPVAAALGTGGQLAITDAAVSLTCLEIVDQPGRLTAYLDAACRAAHSLSTQR